MELDRVARREQLLAEYTAEIRKRVRGEAGDYDWLVDFEYTRGRKFSRG